MINMKNRHFLSLNDFMTQELEFLLDLSSQLKTAKYKKEEHQYLKGKNIALVFEKDSTRTRCAFEVAAYDQGAHVTYIGPMGSHIGVKESIKDTARVLGRMYDAIEYRGHGQNIIEELARYAGVPVWNGLTNEAHPTQVMADFMTMREHSTLPLREVSFCFLGDGRNNVASSLLLGAAKIGMDIRIAAPYACQPKSEIVEEYQVIAQQSGAKIMITDNIEEAVKNVDFLYTDVWVSMGEDNAILDERVTLLRPYQVNQQVIMLTKNPHVKFMHCLPAFHDRNTKVGEEIYQHYGLNGAEVTDDVFESHHSIVFDQAENRLHTIKAIMVATLGL
jgi:ornithine carbamoyltransferase